MILITGAQGQLGQALCRQLGARALGTDLPQLDITNQPMAEKFIKQNPIKAIINCAAYTNVEKAQIDQQRAYAINAAGPAVLGLLCREHQLPLIHISTDYVYDGKKNTPYQENDATGPLSVYGASKLAGDLEVINSGASAIIVRTSWVYSLVGENFVKKMLQLAEKREKLAVVFDQIGTPTYAPDLGAACIRLLDFVSPNICQIFHYSNEGIASWYDFAQAIFTLKKIRCQLSPCLSQEFPTQAQRPTFSVLNKSKIKNLTNLTIPHWQESLKLCLDQQS